MADRNGGFVQNYHDTHLDDPDPGIVMGYYDGADLPTYDFLAREYAIGDRWFASVLGATWPNRLYLTSGKAAGSRDNRGKFSGTQYRNKSWVRQLDAAGVTWKGYGDAAYGHCSIRFTDANYRSSLNYEPFGGSLTGFGFLRDCETGQLPAVSLIDPTFFKDDDHPPADIGLGQAFVARTYNALAKSPAWDRTLLVVVYDEHGGFFDHVPPDRAEDDDPDCRRYGVRVPVFFIGPYVPKGRCFHTTWDHAAIVKTILTRFCSNGGSLPDLGARVAAASHIGEVLSEPVARAAVAMPLPAVRNLLAAARAPGARGIHRRARGAADQRRRGVADPDRATPAGVRDGEAEGPPREERGAPRAEGRGRLTRGVRGQPRAASRRTATGKSPSRSPTLRRRAAVLRRAPVTTSIHALDAVPGGSNTSVSPQRSAGTSGRSTPSSRPLACSGTATSIRSAPSRRRNASTFARSRPSIASGW